VNHSKKRWILMVVALTAILVVAGCKKKQAPAAPVTSQPPAPAPGATLTVSPDTVQRGGAATLSWSTHDATEINIDGMGSVPATGSQMVAPATSTTYHLTAQGPGGTAEASARLTVTEPSAAAPPAAPPAAPSMTDAAMFAKSVKDIFFDFDRYDLRPGADQATIAANAAFLSSHPEIHFTIEGHCDERGSTEYNLALGDNRANAARDALIRAGVQPSQIQTISYGEEKPFCTEHNEECWQLNRRAHFVYGQ
jgi:peptidoglycan-associated lipoprotein